MTVAAASEMKNLAQDRNKETKLHKMIERIISAEFDEVITRVDRFVLLV